MPIYVPSTSSSTFHVCINKKATTTTIFWCWWHSIIHIYIIKIVSSKHHFCFCVSLTETTGKKPKKKENHFSWKLKIPFGCIWKRGFTVMAIVIYFCSIFLFCLKQLKSFENIQNNLLLSKWKIFVHFLILNAISNHKE